jgi:hypothetical protein
VIDVIISSIFIFCIELFNNPLSFVFYPIPFVPQGLPLEREEINMNKISSLSKGSGL